MNCFKTNCIYKVKKYLSGHNKALAMLSMIIIYQAYTKVCCCFKWLLGEVPHFKYIASKAEKMASQFIHDQTIESTKKKF